MQTGADNTILNVKIPVTGPECNFTGKAVACRVAWKTCLDNLDSLVAIHLHSSVSNNNRDATKIYKYI
jgi:hypothetical protein